jgi:ribosomal protein S18 acetylase RimI-like enzyme
MASASDVDHGLKVTQHTANAVPAMRDELIAIHVDARAELLDQPFYSADRFAERLDGYVKAPGFALVTGHVDDLLIGYAFGSPLPVDTRWWTGFDGKGDSDFLRETGSRTFAFREIVVRTAYQRRGHAHRLHDALLAARNEERATLLVRDDNPARHLYARWGWTVVGNIQPYPDSPTFHAMILRLGEGQLG